MIIFHIHEPELQKASQAKSETDCRNKNERLKRKKRISRMKAGRIHFYAGPEQLVYEDASQPHPVKNQVLFVFMRQE
jgi:hypothetical protein